jgi:spore coat polysaccharide biosynthesis protein SpsF
VKTVALIQARMDSRRLPGKALRTLAGHPLLWHVVERTRAARGLDDVVVATSDEPAEEPIRAFCRERNIPCFAGNKHDVLDRFYQAARTHGAEAVVRITGDCPLLDPSLVTRVVQCFAAGDYDHFAVCAGAGESAREGRFPDGLDAECMRFAALERAWREATSPYEREHVTPYLWQNPALFRLGTLLAEGDHSRVRLVVDYPEDFARVEAIYAALHANAHPFGLKEVLELLESRPELAAPVEAHEDEPATDKDLARA